MQPQSKTAFMFQNYRCSLHGGYTERKISIFTLIGGGDEKGNKRQTGTERGAFIFYLKMWTKVHGGSFLRIYFMVEIRVNPI